MRTIVSWLNDKKEDEEKLITYNQDFESVNKFARKSDDQLETSDGNTDHENEYYSDSVYVLRTSAKQTRSKTVTITNTSTKTSTSSSTSTRISNENCIYLYSSQRINLLNKEEENWFLRDEEFDNYYNFEYIHLLKHFTNDTFESDNSIETEMKC